MLYQAKLAIGSDYAASQLPSGTSVGGGTTFASFVGSIIGVINALIPLFATVALLIFFVGLIQFIYHSDSTSERTKGRSLIVWGLVALFVILSLWGILDVAKTSIFPS